MNQDLHDLFLYLRGRGHNDEASEVEQMVGGDTSTTILASLATDYRKQGRFQEAEIIDNMLTQYAQMDDIDRRDMLEQMSPTGAPNDQRDDLTQAATTAVDRAKQSVKVESDKAISAIKEAVSRSSEILFDTIDQLNKAARSAGGPSDLPSKIGELTRLCTDLGKLPEKVDNNFKTIYKKLETVDSKEEISSK